MRFRIPMWLGAMVHDNYYRPNIPIRLHDGSSLGIGDPMSTALYDLQIRLTTVGGPADIINILTGYLYYIGPNELQIRVSELDHSGFPRPIYPLLGTICEDKPQLMPLPASINYEFTFDMDQFRSNLETYLEETTLPPEMTDLPIARDRKNEIFDFENNIDRLLDGLVDDGVSILFMGGAVLGLLSAERTVTIEAKDFKNYSAVDQPLSIINDLDPSSVPRERITGLYKVEDCDADRNPIDSSTNYFRNERDDDRNFTVHAGRYRINHDDFRNQSTVIIHYREGSTIQQDKFPLDPFEKWAIFDSDLRWHLKNWYVSGFLRDDAFIRRLIPEIYPHNNTGALTDYPTTGTDIDPPDPQRLLYDDGESEGVSRPIYNYEVQRLRWGLNRHSEDTFSSVGIRNFREFHYGGAVGIEEYVKRVAAAEFNLRRGVDGSRLIIDLSSVADATALSRVKEGLKAQMISVRTFLLYHWLSGTIRYHLKNPILKDYREILIPHTANFHVHRLDTLNAQVQRSEGIRLIIEDSIAETWGQVITNRGILIDALYFAGHPRGYVTCSNRLEYIEEIKTKYGVNCSLTEPGSDYNRQYGHGWGMSQKGLKILSYLHLTYLQIIHWYYYGIQIRNEYGMGDVITHTPPTLHSNSWLDNPALAPSIPQPLVSVDDDYWRSDSAIERSDPENWYLAHNFRANEFCVDISGGNIPLDVNAELIKKLQELRYKINSAIQVIGVIRPYKIKVHSRSGDFQTNAEAIFGSENVTSLPRSNNWELMGEE